MPHPGELLGGRYRLDDRIASGGMGEVWQATDTVLGRAVAVKTLLADRASDAGFQRRFRHEARALAALRHSGVVAVYDFGSTGTEDAYLVMARVDGQPLNRILAERGRLTPAETMSLVAQAASALAAAHTAGIVHRDVKPGNLLVEPDGTVVLVDFGVARSAHSGTLTGAREVIGTALYIAPEQVTKQEAGPASDVYALGALAFHCLAGHPPFLGKNPIAIVLQHLDQDPPPLPDDVPPEVNAIVRTALAKDPAARFPSAEAMAEAATAAAAELTNQAGKPAAAGLTNQAGKSAAAGLTNQAGETSAAGLGVRARETPAAKHASQAGETTAAGPGTLAGGTPAASSAGGVGTGPAPATPFEPGDDGLAKTRTGAPWFGIAGVVPAGATSEESETIKPGSTGGGPAVPAQRSTATAGTPAVPSPAVPEDHTAGRTAAATEGWAATPSVTAATGPDGLVTAGEASAPDDAEPADGGFVAGTGEATRAGTGSADGTGAASTGIGAGAAVTGMNAETANAGTGARATGAGMNAGEAGAGMSVATGNRGGASGGRNRRRVLAVAAAVILGVAGVVAAADPFGLFGGPERIDRVVPEAPASSAPRTVEQKDKEGGPDNKANYQDKTPKPKKSATSEPSRTPTRPAESRTGPAAEPTTGPTTGEPSTPEQTPDDETSEPGEDETETGENEAADPADQLVSNQ
ncbi:protein kinase [Actinoplanes hulinensis]|uniref:non-specific serine/threonine protein kinase n=1 Tax=Actinoplanes hulinensis TaxID=1144547 RepID=A0ABS7BHI6_9ACTN|nr:protein kinase [Actinoplanes hulinensis]MBW6440366.1 protein kinase [Actinoplanes hulinensis]